MHPHKKPHRSVSTKGIDRKRVIPPARSDENETRVPMRVQTMRPGCSEQGELCDQANVRNLSLRSHMNARLQEQCDAGDECSHKRRIQQLGTTRVTSGAQTLERSNAKRTTQMESDRRAPLQNARRMQGCNARGLESAAGWAGLWQRADLAYPVGRDAAVECGSEAQWGSTRAASVQRSGRCAGQCRAGRAAARSVPASQLTVAPGSPVVVAARALRCGHSSEPDHCDPHAHRSLITHTR